MTWSAECRHHKKRRRCAFRRGCRSSGCSAPSLIAMTGQWRCRKPSQRRIAMSSAMRWRWTAMTDRPDHRIRVGVCLSLSGPYARFGCQAARALEVWRTLDGHVHLVIEDDQSDPQALRRILPHVADGSDVLLSPYSTQLVRAAAAMAKAEGWLLWNHGGSGDDVDNSHVGYLISLLTPASRYPEPFIRRVLNGKDVELWIVSGKGSFGRQVAEGADQAA